jgi:hypothetical protein
VTEAEATSTAPGLSPAAAAVLLAGVADRLEDGLCAVWTAVDRAADLIKADQAIEAGALRATARHLDELIGELKRIVRLGDADAAPR